MKTEEYHFPSFCFFRNNNTKSMAQVIKSPPIPHHTHNRSSVALSTINFSIRRLVLSLFPTCTFGLHFTEHVSHRRTNRFILPMSTAHPATWPTFPLFELIDQSLYMFFPSLLFLDEGYPTNPLITRQWSQILPGCQCLRIHSQSCS